MGNSCLNCGSKIPCSESGFLICGPCACQFPVEENVLLKLAALRKLVRELAELLNYAGQTLTVAAALHHRPPDEYVEQMKAILNREDVKRIMGGE